MGSCLTGAWMDSLSLLCGGLKSSHAISHSVTPRSSRFANGNHLSEGHTRESRLVGPICDGEVQGKHLWISLGSESVCQMRSPLSTSTWMYLPLRAHAERLRCVLRACFSWGQAAAYSSSSQGCFQGRFSLFPSSAHNRPKPGSFVGTAGI